MDIVKNGESSTSPRPNDNGGEASRSKTDGQADQVTRLVMPRLDGMFSSN